MLFIFTPFWDLHPTELKSAYGLSASWAQNFSFFLFTNDLSQLGWVIKSLLYIREGLFCRTHQDRSFCPSCQDSRSPSVYRIPLSYLVGIPPGGMGFPDSRIPHSSVPHVNVPSLSTCPILLIYSRSRIPCQIVLSIVSRSHPGFPCSRALLLSHPLERILLSLPQKSSSFCPAYRIPFFILAPDSLLLSHPSGFQFLLDPGFP